MTPNPTNKTPQNQTKRSCLCRCQTRAGQRWRRHKGASPGSPHLRTAHRWVPGRRESPTHVPSFVVAGLMFWNSYLAVWRFGETADQHTPPGSVQSRKHSPLHRFWFCFKKKKDGWRVSWQGSSQNTWWYRTMFQCPDIYDGVTQTQSRRWDLCVLLLPQLRLEGCELP